MKDRQEMPANLRVPEDVSQMVEALLNEKDAEKLPLYLKAIRGRLGNLGYMQHLMLTSQCHAVVKEAIIHLLCQHPDNFGVELMPLIVQDYQNLKAKRGYKEPTSHKAQDTRTPTPIGSTVIAAKETKEIVERLADCKDSDEYADVMYEFSMLLSRFPESAEWARRQMTGAMETYIVESVPLALLHQLETEDPGVEFLCQLYELLVGADSETALSFFEALRYETARGGYYLANADFIKYAENIEDITEVFRTMLYTAKNLPAEAASRMAMDVYGSIARRVLGDLMSYGIGSGTEIPKVEYRKYQLFLKITKSGANAIFPDARFETDEWDCDIATSSEGMSAAMAYVDAVVAASDEFELDETVESLQRCLRPYPAAIHPCIAALRARLASSLMRILSDAIEDPNNGDETLPALDKLLMQLYSAMSICFASGNGMVWEMSICTSILAPELTYLYGPAEDDWDGDEM